MVLIIKTLADDPLKKPEPPNQNEHPQKDSTQKYLKTNELEKTIYRIGNLLQMSFGQLGAVIIRENVSQGDGSLEIMKAGNRKNAIFMVCRINYYEQILESLEGDSVIYINKVVKIVHD